MNGSLVLVFSDFGWVSLNISSKVTPATIWENGLVHFVLVLEGENIERNRWKEIETRHFTS